MTPVWRVLGMVAALAAALAIAEASVLRMSLNPSDAGVLRLAWTARPDRIEECRQQTEEELSKLPAHMRQSEICEGTTAAYRLEVRHNGVEIAAQVVRGGGLRHDRPLYVSREIQLPPGDAVISVTFARIESQQSRRASEKERGERPRADLQDPDSHAIDPDRRRREGEERLRSREEAIPPVLVLERPLRLASREVVLVTYDPERRQLMVVKGPSQ